MSEIQPVPRIIESNTANNDKNPINNIKKNQTKKPLMNQF